MHYKAFKREKGTPGTWKQSELRNVIVPSEEMRAQRVPQLATNFASQRGPV